jgi:c-di-GMP-binding flagellar brake protein YcgR
MRGSVRVETNIRARFYPVVQSTVGGVAKPVISQRGHSARILDLSESGCAMIAGKGLKKNNRLKLDFFLTDEKRIIVLGTVVNISKTGDERVNKYHIMFLKMGIQSKINILLYVYNIFGEREEKEKTPKKVAIDSAKKDERNSSQ